MQIRQTNERKEFHATDYRSRWLCTRMHTLLVTDYRYHVIFTPRLQRGRIILSFLFLSTLFFPGTIEISQCLLK